MSSHHIVRDEQEPALLFWQPGQLSFEQAGQLLEWSPRVVANQAALEEILAWGIKLDAVWTPPKQQEEVRAAVAHQEPVMVCTFRAGENPQEVLQWLREKNQQSVNLLADAAAAHFALLQQLVPLQQLVQVQVLSQGWRYSFFRPGFVLKWLPQSSMFRIISFSDAPEVSNSQVEAIQQKKHMQEYRLSRSGLLKINAAEPFWLGEQI